MGTAAMKLLKTRAQERSESRRPERLGIMILNSFFFLRTPLNKP